MNKTGEASVLSTVQVPLKVYIGDSFELIINFIPSDYTENLVGETVKILSEPEEYFPPWDIKGMRLEGGENIYTLRLELRAWKTGTQKLPPLLIGEELLRDIEFEVSSVLEEAGIGEEGREPAPPAPSLLPPGTGLFIYTGISLLFLFVVGAVLLKKKVFPALRRHRLRAPRLKVLRQMARIVEAKKKRDAYADLEAFVPLLRRWLSIISNTDLSAYTAVDLSRLRHIDAELFAQDNLKAHQNLFAIFDRKRFSPTKGSIENKANREEVFSLLLASYQAAESTEKTLLQRELGEKKEEKCA